MPKFSARSLNRLMTCDQRLQQVMLKAIEKYDFMVLEGRRTLARQKQLVAKGTSWTMNSKHLRNPAMAVDIAPYPLDWKNEQRFRDMAKVVMNTAKELGITLEWGGNWGGKKFDGPHFQIPDQIKE